jgi:nucleotide-binding universal stress UspA family protein
MSEKKILVPIDFSEQSLVALSQTYNLARFSNSTITLLYVNYKGSDSDSKLKDIKDKLEQKIKEIKQEQKIDAEYLIEEGKVYDQIIKVAEKTNAKFMAIGFNGTKGLTAFIGHNTLRLVRLSPCPVITIKGKSHRNGCKNIVLPLDFTKETRVKVAKAIEIAEYFGSTVHIVMVVENKEYEAKIMQYALQTKKMIEEKGIKCTTDKISGSKVANLVIEYSEKVEADLILIMTQEELGINEMLIGSTAQKIINFSDIPVLSIRPPKSIYTSFSNY